MDCGCTAHYGYHYEWIPSEHGHSMPILNKSTAEIIRFRECHDQCSCNPSHCKNRVTQQRNRGLSLYIQFNPHTQWGLFTDTSVLNGQFVIEFVGEILDERERREREIKNYMLTVNEIVGDEVISSVTVDPRRYGNAARFINHSCSPNLIPQLVWSLTDIPTVKLFAIRDIRKGEELTFHYGVIGDVHSQNIASSQRCLCGSTHCQGYLPHCKGT